MKNHVSLDAIGEDTKPPESLPPFDKFFHGMYDHLEKMYDELMSKVTMMAPLLIKVEEILVASRSQRSPRLADYYRHWEKKLFDAVVEMTTANLETYSNFLRTKSPRFAIRSLLQMNDVVLDPEASVVLDGSIRVVRNLIDGTKRFVRFYK